MMAIRSVKNLRRTLLGIILFAAFIVFVEYYIGWRALLSSWARLSWPALAGAVFLVFLSYAARAMRQYDYFLTEMRGCFALNFKLMLQHNLLNNLLPMRAGELSFPVLMSRYFAVPMSRSLPALLWFRLLDMHVLILLALIALGTPILGWPVMLVCAALWTLLPLPFFRVIQRLHAAVDTENSGKIRAFIMKARAGLPQTMADARRSWFWTLVNWLVKVGVFAWILLLFIEAPVDAAWMGVIAGDVTTVLPIHSVAGMGTYEAGVVAGLLPYGLKADQALAAAVNLHLFLLASTLIGGGLSLLMGTKQAHG